MIIIQKTPYEIKHLHNTLSLSESPEIAQKTIQGLYAQDCFSLERMLIRDGGFYSFQNGDDLQSLPASLILSFNQKSIILNKDMSASLRMYQLRTRDASKSESILVEPFYPSFKSSLFDIFGILKDIPYSNVFDAYRFSVLHTPRIRQHIRRTFRTVIPELFNHGTLTVYSFEEFYQVIHHLEESRLRAIFKTAIHFVKLYR